MVLRGTGALLIPESSIVGKQTSGLKSKRATVAGVLVIRFGDAVLTTHVTGCREISSGDAAPVIHA